MPTNKPKVIAVVGPTASGKTSLAIELAKRYDGEVISADSRQVYRGLDEGTAKVTKSEMADIPHHLIDVCDIDTVYTAADFDRDARAAIADITSRGKVPIIAGGTFFYIDQLRNSAQVAPARPNKALRTALDKQDTETLLATLRSWDPRRAADIDPANRRRIIRALEIISVLGEVPKPTKQESDYEFFMLGIDVPKSELRERFSRRAEEWIAGPFEHEVRGLLAEGVSRNRLAEIGFEYLLMLEYIDGTLSKQDFVQKCIEKNWQYAKRQYTWLKKDNDIHWFTREQFTDAIARVGEFIG